MNMKNLLSLLIFILTISVESSDLNIKNINSQIDLLVHKTPTCGCCKMWVNHIENNGFTVKTEDHKSLLSIKEKLKIELNL